MYPYFSNLARVEHFWKKKNLCWYPRAQSESLRNPLQLRQLFFSYHEIRGTRWHSWLRHCATSRKVAGSIPDGVIGIFHWHNPSGCTMALGSTQLLTEINTRNISWGQRRPMHRADKLTTFTCQLSWNLGASTSWHPQGLSRPGQGLLYLYHEIRVLEHFKRNEMQTCSFSANYAYCHEQKHTHTCTWLRRFRILGILCGCLRNTSHVLAGDSCTTTIREL